MAPGLKKKHCKSAVSGTRAATSAPPGTKPAYSNVVLKKIHLTVVPTHDESGKSFYALGQKLGKQIVEEFEKDPKMTWNFVPPNLSLEGKKAGVFDRFFDAKRRLLPGKRRDDLFREAMTGYDELLSTASVRKIVEGLVSGIPPDKLKPGSRLHSYVNDAVEMFSDLRIATPPSGYLLTAGEESLGIGMMQHPPPKRGGFFHPVSTGSAHSALDRTRRAVAQSVMSESLKNKSRSEEVFKSGARAAISFTTNYFTSPSDAENVLRTGLADDASIDAADQERDHQKLIHVALGGVLRPGGVQARTAPWQKGLQRHASPDAFFKSGQPLPHPSPLRQRRKPASSAAASASSSSSSGSSRRALTAGSAAQQPIAQAQATSALNQATSAAGNLRSRGAAAIGASPAAARRSGSP